jgi:hypothetical protein
MKSFDPDQLVLVLLLAAAVLAVIGYRHFMAR